MNYFAHAFPFIVSGAEDPFFVCGLAVPDWLNVVDRKVKARSRSAKSFLDSGVSETESHLARGVVQHHFDDDWFHQNRAFNELCLEFTVELREILQPDPGFRPSFLGHILVELFLDELLIRRFPSEIESYYQIIRDVDAGIVEKIVSQFSTKPAVNLEQWIGRFHQIQFLYDYADNEKLLGRLNQIMQRVKLRPLPDRLFSFFESARKRIEARVDELYFEPSRQAGTLNAKDP